MSELLQIFIIKSVFFFVLSVKGIESLPQTLIFSSIYLCNPMLYLILQSLNSDQINWIWNFKSLHHQIAKIKRWENLSGVWQKLSSFYTGFYDFYVFEFSVLRRVFKSISIYFEKKLLFIKTPCAKWIWESE